MSSKSLCEFQHWWITHSHIMKRKLRYTKGSIHFPIVMTETQRGRLEKYKGHLNR
ncbi:hypothetical protein RchiOBHm_Chr7g0215691 [Rosa chinensis]|uniref:Uncharacterized protein n=1 Tax=Rosa chinensis TaxID=74649 RepID=A0A2P6PBJ7_ROSCH|nr:hypothetical protein RchiOBHm_Chr7g0215691 [Rosa chinensis]